MKFLFSWLKKFAFLLLLVIFHFFISYLLPFPLNAVNILFAALVLSMMWSESGSVVWMAFFMHFLIELYSVSLFGLILLSSTLSILLTFWFLKYFFTNRSWYSALFLTFIALSLYRSFFLFFLTAVNFFTNRPSIPWFAVLPLYGWELLLTLIVVALGYGSIFRLREKVKAKKTIFL